MQRNKKEEEKTGKGMRIGKETFTTSTISSLFPIFTFISSSSFCIVLFHPFFIIIAKGTTEPGFELDCFNQINK